MPRAQRESSFLNPVGSRITPRSRIYFLLLFIFVYINEMLLVAIKLALSGSLKNPVLVFDGLTSDGAEFYIRCLCGVCHYPQLNFSHIHLAQIFVELSQSTMG